MRPFGGISPAAAIALLAILGTSRICHWCESSIPYYFFPVPKRVQQQPVTIP
jgi:hypothetical protein